jgi:hypothetical protein
MNIPDLGLEENKDALKLLLDRKYEEIESAILRERDDISHLNYLEQMDRLRAHAKLEARRPSFYRRLALLNRLKHMRWTPMPWSALMERTMFEAIIAEAFAGAEFSPLYAGGAAA